MDEGAWRTKVDRRVLFDEPDDRLNRLQSEAGR